MAEQPLVSILTSVVSGLAGETAGSGTGAEASAAWSSANRAMYYPIYLVDPCIVTKLWVLNGATASGNIDMGVYLSAAGLPTTRLVSIGSTAQTGTNVLQEFDIADTELQGQTLYFIGLALDNGTGTVFAIASVAGPIRAAGVVQQAAAFPLPSSATPVVAVSTQLADCGISIRNLVA